MEAVRKAIDEMRKKDIFERVMSREMRRAGLKNEDYIRIISDIRDLARKRKVGLAIAAEEYLSKQQ
jgi:hypothetical protein